MSLSHGMIMHVASSIRLYWIAAQIDCIYINCQRSYTSDHISSKVWDDITYIFLDLSAVAVEV